MFILTIDTGETTVLSHCRSRKNLYAFVTVRCWRRYIFRLLVRPSVFLKRLWTWYFINRLENFTKFAILVQLATDMNWLNYEVERSKVKVTTRPSMNQRCATQRHCSSVYYPNVTTLRSNLCYRKSICLSSVVCLSVSLQRWCTLLRRLKLSAIFLPRCIPWAFPELRAKFYGNRPRETSTPGTLNARGLAKLSESGPVEGYLINGTRYGLGCN